MRSTPRVMRAGFERTMSVCQVTRACWVVGGATLVAVTMVPFRYWSRIQRRPYWDPAHDCGAPRDVTPWTLVPGQPVQWPSELVRCAPCLAPPADSHPGYWRGATDSLLPQRGPHR